MMQAKQAPIEYTVYTFDLPTSRQKGENSWKRQFCSLDRDLAIAQAKILSQTQKFYKIEIRQKFFDLRLGRTIDKKFKTMKSKEKTISKRIGLAFAGAGSIFVFVSFFLTQIG